jgi:hypothetical protein
MVGPDPAHSLKKEKKICWVEIAQPNPNFMGSAQLATPTLLTYFIIFNYSNIILYIID